ncbi:phosphate ABC transporter permease subunit PstC [Neomicrococcus aestuarii]|uniref:Phosphate transport system permease protein n=1 Tax=Neomicrococcus aestuarii TaxID=556325 RepID=A0A7W8TTR0_9MICC|nr:phosphate ABC transporter permease subunit PstC [Neomicrococcus aestuarii]MBB5512684.1 phosphate transport system permease protein [Neomicrococcus aestuarii]
MTETTTSNALFDKSSSAGRAGDKVFSTLALVAGILILAVLALVAAFLVTESIPALTAGEEELSGEHGNFWTYVLPLMGGTIIASAIALLLATPVAVGVALFISHYAPRKLSQLIGYVIDLLAAIPSVVYGAWGMATLGPLMVPLYEWLQTYLGWIPLFSGPASTTGRTILTAGVVLSVMVLPIITSMCREIFVQTPKLHEEAALALGATRWEMVKMSVFPFARAGIISAIMLGLGRALGETMAVTLVLSPGGFTWNLIGAGNQTIPSEIALNFPEAFGMRQSELIAAGLVLFVITLAVNMIARWIVNRHKEFSGAN